MESRISYFFQRPIDIAFGDDYSQEEYVDVLFVTKVANGCRTRRLCRIRLWNFRDLSEASDPMGVGSLVGLALRNSFILPYIRRPLWSTNEQGTQQAMSGFAKSFRRELSSLAALSALTLCLGVGTSRADIELSFDSTSQSSNSPATGASAFVVLTFADEAGDVRVSLAVTNTTGLIPSFGAGATESMLTGIALDLPASSSVSLASFTNAGFSILS